MYCIRSAGNLLKFKFGTHGYKSLEILQRFLKKQKKYYSIPAKLIAEKKYLPGHKGPKDADIEIVLVTGGGGCLGRALALRFANNPLTKVVVWDINEEENFETAKQVRQLGGEIYAYHCDLASKKDIYRTAEETRKDVGDVTILINNAGIVTGRPLLDIPDHMIRKTFDINIISNFWTVKAFLPTMIKQGKGHIVTIACVPGFLGLNRLVDYSASKFAAVGFDEALHMELMSHGYSNIHTTIVCPYFVTNDMFAGLKSEIQPILDPDRVADDTFNGIVNRKRIVYIPRYTRSLIFLKTFLPWSWYCQLLDILRFNSVMNAFQGKAQDHFFKKKKSEDDY